MASKERGGLSKREFAAQKKGTPAVKPAAKVSSKDRGGLSGREFAAAQVGGKLDYKTGKVTKPAPVTKKVTYNMSSGYATARPVYGPAIPASFSKMQAVQNYTPANKNYSSASGGGVSKISSAQPKNTFTQNVKSGIKSVAGGLFTKIKTVAGLNDDSKIRAKDVARELPGATKSVAKGIGKFAADVTRGVFIQAPTTALLSFKEGLTGKNEEYVPQTKFEKVIAGDKPIISINKRQKIATETSQKLGLSKNKSILAGAGIAAGSVLADALPGAGKAAGKGISAGGRKVLDAALKAGRSKAEIEAIVRADAKGAYSSVKTGAADAGRAISDVTTTHSAKAAEFTPANKNASMVDDVVVPRGTEDIPKVSTKKQIERTDVEAAKETAKESQTRIQKTIDDYKKAPKDELGNISPDIVKALDDTLKGERESLAKAYKDVTGEDLPDDIEADEVLAKLDKFGADNERNFQLQDGARRSSKEAFDFRQTGKPTRKEVRDLNGGRGKSKAGILTLARRKKLLSKNDEAYGGANKSGTGENKSGTGVNVSETGVNVSGTADVATKMKTFERAKGLNPKDARIENAAFKKVATQEEKIIQEYIKKNGKIVNTDNFRPFFKDEGYAGHNAAAVQEPSSYLAKRAFTEGLKNEGKYATLYAGGSGTGKTSAIKDIPEVSDLVKKSSVVFDGNLSSTSSAIKKIEEGGNAGKKVPIVYVYRDPMDSFTNGVVKRMKGNKDEMGRLVPSSTVAENHIGSWETIKELHKRGLDIRFIDNSNGPKNAKLVTFEELNQKINYPDQKALAAQFDAEADRLYRSGEINQFEYRGYTGKSAPKVSGPASKRGAALRKAVDEMATKAQEVVQDNWIRVKKLQESPDAKVDPNKLTPYEAETLFHGRVGHRLETANDTLAKIDKELAVAEKTLKNPELRKDIDQYLIAKHAPERNAIHGKGAAGMTDEEAADIVKSFEGKEGNEAAMKIAQQIKETNHQTLEILHDAQVIDDAAYKTLRETYKEHVPLYRILDEDEDVAGALSSKGYDVRSSGLKKAKGSDKEVDDILTNVAANLEQAIVRAEKNRVNLATLNFARENKELGLFEEIKPRAIGTTFAKEGEEGKPILEQVTDPLVLTVRENGKPVYLRIKDENLALAFKGIGNEKLPPVLSFISGFTRLYSGLATRFNPEFVLSNKLRDLQEMAVYMASQKDIGFSGAGKAALRDGASMKDVIAGMRGKDTPGAKLYNQMMEDGGTTGGQALSTKTQLKLDIEDMRKLNRGGILNMRKQGKRLVDAFDSWNQVFEDSTRLSVYKTALDKGLSREKAAIMAKNATINFNKKGTGGPVLNGLYMFANASIQGSTKLVRAMKNPKVAAAVSTAVGGSVWVVNNWNDKVDPEWRDKVSEWDRDANLVVVLPDSDGGSRYLTIPVSWGLKPMKVMADMAYDASNGHLSEGGILKGTGKVLSSVWDAYNPAGGTDAVSSAVPSFLDIPVEIARNQKWSGSKMRPEDKEGVPASENFFQNKEGVPSDKSKIFGLLRKGTAAVADKTGGAVQINPANLKYALDGYLSGFGRSITGAIETGTAVAKGGLPQASDAPFTRRFYKDKTPEEVQTVKKYDARDELYETLKATPKEKQATVIQKYLNNLPADQRKGAAYGLSQEGFTTKGVTTSDDVIRMKDTVAKVNKLEDEGKYDEVDAIIEGMSEEDQKAFKNAAKSIKAKETSDMKEKLTPKVQPIADQIIELENAGKYDESDALFYGLSEDEQKVVQSLVKNK